MKRIFLFLLGLTSAMTMAAETITIVSPYSASHSGTPAMFRIVNEANSQQKDYNFILEFRPGGEQIIAVNALKEQPATRLAIVAPKFVEHVQSGRLNRADYVPIHALGDACWAVITNMGNTRQGIASLRGIPELTGRKIQFPNQIHIIQIQL